MISKGHQNALLYPMSFFKVAIEEAQNSEIESQQSIALAMRVARFADDREFKKFLKKVSISKLDKKNVATNSEIEDFFRGFK